MALQLWAFELLGHDLFGKPVALPDHAFGKAYFAADTVDSATADNHTRKNALSAKWNQGRD